MLHDLDDWNRAGYLAPEEIRGSPVSGDVLTTRSVSDRHEDKSIVSTSSVSKSVIVRRRSPVNLPPPRPIHITHRSHPDRTPRRRDTDTNMYVPSWLDKVEKSRKEMQEKGSETSRELLLKQRLGDDLVGSDSYSYLSPRLSALLNDDGFSPHELLEKQYKMMKESLLAPPRYQDDTQLCHSYNKLTKARQKARSKKDHARGVGAASSELSDSVSVKDLLDSDDSIGSDHYFRHLQCVKELAKRYRKNRRKRHIGSILEVEDT